MLEPSLDVKIDLICFSPTIEDFSNFRSSITNLGSGFPDPKGDKKLGISQLDNAAKNSFYTRTEAQFFLMKMGLFLFREK